MKLPATSAADLHQPNLKIFEVESVETLRYCGCGHGASNFTKPGCRAASIELVDVEVSTPRIVDVLPKRVWARSVAVCCLSWGHGRPKVHCLLELRFTAKLWFSEMRRTHEPWQRCFTTVPDLDRILRFIRVVGSLV